MANTQDKNSMLSSSDSGATDVKTLAGLLQNGDGEANKKSKSNSRSRTQTPKKTPSPIANGVGNGDLKKSVRKSSRLFHKLASSPSLEPSPIINSNSNSDGADDKSVENGISGVIKRGSELIFIEPTPTEPKPIYTGLPLEAPPPQKLKKEALWPNKKKKARKSREDTPVDDLDMTPEEIKGIITVEAKYNAELASTFTDDISTLSNARTPPLKIKLRQNVKKQNYYTPKPTKRKDVKQRTPTRGSKRVKVISPKKLHSTNLAPLPVTETESKKKEDDETKDNDDFCSSCGGSGIFICCESCPKSFHFTCCNPPLEEVPEDDWYCRECIAIKFPHTLTNWNDIGIFSQLLNQQESRNPFEFQLPINFRENTFIGVTTGDNGEYTDDSLLPELSYSKANGAQIKGFNKNVDLEIDSLYDKNGDAYLCHKCKESGLNRRTLVHCDYCSLVWHLDCLDEPMCSPKTIGSKWRCPNHIENLLPKHFLNYRVLKDTQVKDSTLFNQFLTLANHSNFLIHHSDQPFLKQKVYPQISEYLQYESEDFVNAGNIEKINDKVEIPNYFENIAVANGVSAKLNNVKKIIDGSDKLVFRVPEKLIVLDFISKVTRDTKSNILANIQQYDFLARVETNIEDQEVYSGLNEIKTNPRNKFDFGELVKVALENTNMENPSSSMKSNDDKDGGDDDYNDKDLMHIKKLIELKGRDALLKFLKS